jgi:hypothetical protein
LTLETGGAVSFKPRLLEGVPSKEITPTELLLDGQQRITSLYQATWSDSPVQTKNEKGQEIERYYYLDIKKAVNGEVPFEDSIVGLPADKAKRTNFGRDVVIDLNAPESEHEHDMFPLNKTFDASQWQFEWMTYNRKHNRESTKYEDYFVKKFLATAQHYKMPIIELAKNSSREAICLVFEKVNVGGKKLEASDLLTAIYSADNYRLREDLNRRLKGMIKKKKNCGILEKVAIAEFLQSCTVLHTHEMRKVKLIVGYTGNDLPQVSCDRDSLLALPLIAYEKHADSVEKGFIDTAKFLNELKIFRREDISYPPAIITLASVFGIINKTAASASSKQKLAQWFWSISLGEIYSSGTDTIIAKDSSELVSWITDQQQLPTSMSDAMFQLNRLDSLRNRKSAAYKALHTLIMKQGCRDFITGRQAEIMSFFEDEIDIHHIFPKAWCTRNEIDPLIYNSIINKTALCSKTNKTLGGIAPSKYLKKIETSEKITSNELDAILESHFINPSHLRNDDFNAFFEDRKKKLSDLIATAMQKPVFEGAGSNEPVIDIKR